MPTTYRVLGQSRPATATPSELYRNESFEDGAVISTLSVTNVTDVSSHASIYITAVGATTFPNSLALMRNVEVFPKSTLTLTLGVTLEEGKSIFVQAAPTGALTFQAFGSEIS